MAKKEQKIIHIEGLEDASAEPRVYELGFHLDPELPQEEVKKAYQTVRETIAGVGTIIAEGEPVKLQLAYRISRMDTTGRRDFNTAFFCWIAYEADGPGHDTISTMAREDARIIRFLDIRTTADEAKHSADMQEIFIQAAADAAAAGLEEEMDTPVLEAAPVAVTPEEEAV